MATEIGDVALAVSVSLSFYSTMNQPLTNTETTFQADYVYFVFKYKWDTRERLALSVDLYLIKS